MSQAGSRVRRAPRAEHPLTGRLGHPKSQGTRIGARSLRGVLMRLAPPELA